MEVTTEQWIQWLEESCKHWIRLGCWTYWYNPEEIIDMYWYPGHYHNGIKYEGVWSLEFDFGVWQGHGGYSSLAGLLKRGQWK